MPGTVLDTEDKAGNLKHTTSVLVDWPSSQVGNKGGWRRQSRDWGVPTLDRAVTEGLFWAEQSQVDISGKGVGYSG